MIRVGILGAAGFIGGKHRAAFRNNTRSTVVALADTDAGRLHFALSESEKAEVKLYQSLAELLADDNVDAVSICTPNWTHRQAITESFRHGKAVLCEKPLALSLADVEDVIDTLHRESGKLMVGHCIRFWPQYATAKTVVDHGSLGSLVGGRFTRRAACPKWSTWVRDESLSGGAILDLGIHDVDFAIHLAGPPNSVDAVGTRWLERGLDVFHGKLLYDQALIAVDGGWFSTGEYSFEMSFDILCTKGLLHFNSLDGGKLILTRHDGHTEEVAVDVKDAYQSEIDYFVDCVLDGKPFDACPPTESALAVKLALLMRESRDRNGARADFCS